MAWPGAWGCQTIVEELPQRPSEVAPCRMPVVVVPVPVPGAPPPGTDPLLQIPLPAPGRHATAPVGHHSLRNPHSPAATGQSCRLPPGNGSGHDCPRQSPTSSGRWKRPSTMLVGQEPGDLRPQPHPGLRELLLVRNVARYLARMPEMLAQRGLCSRWDGEEMAVKNSNAFNEQFDILTSSGYIRRQGGSYRATCSRPPSDSAARSRARPSLDSPIGRFC